MRIFILVKKVVFLVCIKSALKADYLSLQKPLVASQQVLDSSQNNFLSSHEYDSLMNIGLACLSETAKSCYYDHSTTY